MERVPNEGDLLACPYNSSHLIMRCNYNLHIIRCRRSNDKGNLTKCPLNNSHLMPKNELDEHVLVCENRKNFERFKHNDAEINGLSTTKPKSFNANKQKNDFFDVAVECEENWDDEPEQQTYNPLSFICDKYIIRHPVGMTPSERVAFRNYERSRLREMRNNNVRR